MNATKNPFGVIEPREAFDTVPLCRSSRQQGARFDSRQPIAVLRAERHRSNHSLPASNGFIFVVDTYPGLAEFAKTILDHAGFTTCAFHDATIAWHAFAFAYTSPQLLIVNDSKDELSGLELIRLCKAINPGLKVILVRDHAADPGRLSPGMADAVLHQPYCGPLLVQEVRRLCAPVSRDPSHL